MAMLAEPRRRKRYNLCPRGKALYEDDTRYGTKMLEKMGWSKGRGLGAHEDGSLEFVRVRFKNDAEGLGYEMRDDQWTTHEEGFNGLLKALSGDGDNANKANDNGSASEDDARPMGFGFQPATVEEVKSTRLKEKISGISLEEKSKHSKARVHYKKFTRGKDLSQYSEKDLANIFGKKATEDIETPVQAEEQPEEEEKPVNANFAGVQTVGTGLSVTDYFKQKMEAIKQRLANNQNTDSAAPKKNPFMDETAANPEEEPSKKKKKNKDKKREEEREYAENAQLEEPAVEQKKKKKSKRAAEVDPAELEIGTVATEEANPPKRKKKNNQERTEDLKATEEAVATEETDSKKKKNHNHEPTENHKAPEEAMATEEANPPKRKKKKNGNQDPTEDLKTSEEVVPTEETNPSKHKKKNGTLEPTEDLNALEIAVVTEETNPPKRKKKKNDNQATTEDLKAPEEAVVTEETNPPKRKKKKNDNRETTEELKAPGEATPLAVVATETEAEPKKKKKSKNKEEPLIESPEETELNETPAKKKSKKSKKGELQEAESKKENENPEIQEAIEDSQLNEETTSKTKKKKSKTKAPKVESDSEQEQQPSKAEKKEKKDSKKLATEVSANPVDNESSSDDSDSQAAKESGEYLSTEQLAAKLDSYNVYEISSFCAEKFHILNMNAFKNSSLAQINGYTYDENIRLDVVEATMDAQRITSLWEGKTIKYIFKKRVAVKFKFQRVNPSDIKKINRVKAFSGL